MDSLDTEKVRKRFVNTAVFREVSLVIGGAFLALALFSYLPLLWPPFGEYSAAFVAAAFIYLPAWAVWRKKEHLGTIGVFWPKPASWLPAITTIAVIFTLFAGAFFAYHQLVNGKTPCIGIPQLADWPEVLTVGDDPDGGALRVTTRQRGLLITNRQAPGPVDVTIEPQDSDARLAVGRRIVAADSSSPVRIPPSGWLHVEPPHGPSTITIDGPENGQIMLPGNRTQTLPFTAERGYLWLLTLLFVQFILIALPEELLFRGYLQTRLQQLLPQRWIILGGDVGPAVLLTSIIFALSHLVAVPGGYRLAVFFPSIFFGWLRDRTGSIAAAVVGHALANVLMQVLLRWLC